MRVGDKQLADGRKSELTLASVWAGAAGRALDDDMLEWPPDVFAVTDVLLQRADAFRFVLSPLPGAVWPPERMVGWADLVGERRGNGAAASRAETARFPSW
jgi:hypothetical protein